MANISGWMIYPVDDTTEFYCSFFFVFLIQGDLKMKIEESTADGPATAMSLAQGETRA